ncbi:hypothetical protein AM588_10002276 [Phytophthora nicotianae]|uniref:Uncharacterized protein n=1 Tax=Phytophthora nicotianae TaxID=4792 RepID=A0A0W8CZK4_PHYNI|nr:hypothetical protein AM588_10002276 [Phytophthora nicotianae]
MSLSTLRRRSNRGIIKEEGLQSGEDRGDSCPLLSEDERPSSNVQRVRIRDVRRIDNGVLTSKRNLVQRIQSRKNRLVQRVLVACRLAGPSRDQTFKQNQTSNRTVIEQLVTIRSSLFEHSESVVTICSFAGNSTSLQDDAELANVTAEGLKIHEYSLAFSDHVEKSVLPKIDLRIAELERIDSFIEKRTKLVLDVEYAKRTLQAAQLQCEQATRFITEQLKFVQPNHGTDMLELFQEVKEISIACSLGIPDSVVCEVRADGGSVFSTCC